MIRTEALWITAFLAVGAVGGLVYNWPSDPVVESQVASDTIPESAVDVSLGTTEPSRQVPNDAPLRESPQGESSQAAMPQVALPQAALPTDADIHEPTEGIWSEVSPDVKRSQPIDTSVLELGDRYLEGGNSVGAYQHYTKLWQRSSLPIDTAVLLRLALASERAGLLDQASDHYRSVIRVAKKGTVQQIMGLLGTARVWELDQQLDDSIALLGELYLLYAHEEYPEIVRQSIIKQLADCLQKRLVATNLVTDALVDEPMQYHWAPQAVRPLLEAADFEAPGAPPVNSATGINLLQNPRGDLSLVLVEARLEAASVIKVLEDLAQKTGLQFQFTEKARSEMVGRLANVNTAAMPVSLMMDQMLEPLQLSWSQGDGVVSVLHRDELSEKDMTSYELARTQRMLQQVQLNFQNGVVRTAALMNEGNNARLSGGWDVAKEKYRSARDARPMHEMSAKLYFNEASLGLVHGEKLNSLHACYMTLDQTLSGVLQANVYAMIAELELEFGQLGKAITAGSRGIRRADEPQLTARMAMTLARAYLLSDDPYSANAVLFDATSQLQDSRYRGLAAVLGTYARFLHVKPKVGLQDEGQRLVLALAAMKPTDVQTFADALIVSDAYAAIGLRGKSTGSLEQALDIAPAGYWNDKIRLRLARLYHEESRFEKSNEMIESFGVVSPDLLPEILSLHASVQLELGNLERCGEICRRVLAMDASEERKSECLDLLGKSLQRMGDHYAAALCFAGLLPALEMVESGQETGVMASGESQ